MRRFLDLFRISTIPAESRHNYLFEVQHYLLWIALAGTIDINFNSIVAKKTFGASDALTTFVWAIPILANILNVVWGAVLRGRRRIPAMMAIIAGISISVASISFTPAEGGAWIFAAQLGVIFTLWSGLITLRTSLWQVNYPKTHRAQIAGRLQILRLVGVMTVPLLLGKWYDHDPSAYHYVYPLVAVIGLLSLIPLSRMKITQEAEELRAMREHLAERQATAAKPRHSLFHALHDAWAILRDDHAFRAYMIAQFLLGGANFFTEPTLLLVVSEDLGLGYFESAMVMSVLTAVVTVITTPLWSPFFDRVGIFRYRVWNSGAWCLSYLTVALAMLMLSQSWTVSLVMTALLMVVLSRILRGVGAGGGHLAWPLGHLAFAEPHNANLYFGIHVGLTGVRGALMPALSQVLQKTIGNMILAGGLLLAVSAHLMFRYLVKYDRHLPTQRPASHPRPDQATTTAADERS
jgi:hypothetical protein